ncbi:MAG: ATP-binding cassette domain-containing protein [Actinomycetota bacterium]
MDAVRLDGVEVVIPGGRRILGPVDLSVQAGERWALLGPNGSGKTTLLSVAGAWRHPSAGRATVLGEILGRTDVRRLRARIGHVGHSVTERLRPGIDCADAVLAGRVSALETWCQTFTDDDRAEARAMLAEVGCAHVADRALSTCSQGERARVLLARARFGRRELLLFDEPAAGLDLPGREALLEAMETTARTVGAPTSLLATHHLEEIPPSTSHAAMLRAGRLVAAGPIEEVLTDAAVSECFGMAIAVARRAGRWSAIAE